jgi:hypothetical protein
LLFTKINLCRYIEVQAQRSPATTAAAAAAETGGSFQTMAEREIEASVGGCVHVALYA